MDRGLVLMLVGHCMILGVMLDNLEPRWMAHILGEEDSAHKMGLMDHNMEKELAEQRMEHHMAQE
jgi:hypothetical protein